jgi:hypothetical protein
MMQHIDIVDLTDDFDELEMAMPGVRKKETGVSNQLQVGFRKQRGRKRPTDDHSCDTYLNERGFKRPFRPISQDPANVENHSPAQFFSGDEALLGAAGNVDPDAIFVAGIQSSPKGSDKQPDRQISAAYYGTNHWARSEESADGCLLAQNDGQTVEYPEDTQTKRLEGYAKLMRELSISLAGTYTAALRLPPAYPVREGLATSKIAYSRTSACTSLSDEDFTTVLEPSASRIEHLQSELQETRQMNSEVVYQQAIEGHVDMELVDENKALTAQIEALALLRQQIDVYQTCSARHANLTHALVKNMSRGGQQHADPETLVSYSISSTELKRARAKICELLQVGVAFPQPNHLDSGPPQYVFSKLALFSCSVCLLTALDIDQTNLSAQCFLCTIQRPKDPNQETLRILSQR